MQNGKFAKGTSDKSGNWVTTLSIPTTDNIDFVTLSIILVNTEDTEVDVSIAIADAVTTTPSTADFVDIKTTLEPYGSLERECALVSPGEKIMIQSTSTTGGTAYRIHGIIKEL